MEERPETIVLVRVLCVPWEELEPGARPKDAAAWGWPCGDRGGVRMAVWGQGSARSLSHSRCLRLGVQTAQGRKKLPGSGVRQKRLGVAARLS